MAEFVANTEYTLVIYPFNAVQTVTTIEHQQAIFESVYDALVTISTLIGSVG